LGAPRRDRRARVALVVHGRGRAHASNRCLTPHTPGTLVALLSTGKEKVHAKLNGKSSIENHGDGENRQSGAQRSRWRVSQADGGTRQGLGGATPREHAARSRRASASLPAASYR